MNSLFHDYLIERDGASKGTTLGGHVLLSGAELKRIATAAGVSVRHLYQIAMGSKRGSWRVAAIIERETGGRVPAASIMPPAPAKETKQHRRSAMK